MGRWNFDGFPKLEKLVTSSIDRCRAMRLRLVAIEKCGKQGGENEKEQIETLIKGAIARLNNMDLSSDDASSIGHQEDKILDPLDQKLHSLMLWSAAEEQSMRLAKKNDEAANQILSKKSSSTSVHRSPPRTTITFSIRRLGGENEWRQILNSKCTLADLADRLSNTSPQIGNDPRYDLIPDFWCEKHDTRINCVSKSGVYWERQQWNTKVADVEGIEVVAMQGDYVVIVLLQNGREFGMPMGLIPGHPRQSAKDHIEDKFKEHTVKRILCPASKRDASRDLFDKVFFPDRVTALYVEVDYKAKHVQGGLSFMKKGKEREHGERKDGSWSGSRTTLTSSTE